MIDVGMAYHEPSFPILTMPAYVTSSNASDYLSQGEPAFVSSFPHPTQQWPNKLAFVHEYLLILLCGQPSRKATLQVWLSVHSLQGKNR